MGGIQHFEGATPIQLLEVLSSGNDCQEGTQETERAISQRTDTLSACTSNP
jgi:hypothetical protein